MPLITIHDAVCRISRSSVLRVGSFEVCLGQHWCIFGGNGSGKSLLARLLGGERMSGRSHVSYHAGFEPSRDVVTVSFEEQQRLCEVDNRHDISEFSDLPDTGTTVEFLIRADCPVDDRYRELIALLGLDALQNKGIRYLSSGQLRKVMIARALFRDPTMIIFDDPLESIDRESRSQIQSAICAWQGSDNCSVILSRRHGDIVPGATHMALMKNLQVVVQGSLEDIRRSEPFRSLVEQKPGAVRLPEAMPAADTVLAGNVGTPLIELRDVQASWAGKPVLEGVNWIFGIGDHALIEGPNGCGKSTLLSLIAGENHKAYGQHVVLFGKRRGSGETVWDIKSHFGVVSNEMHQRYIRGWRVLDVVVSGFFDTVGLYDDCGSSHRQAARCWLEALEIEHLAAESYQELSFGQQRLVLLARAMVKMPHILILDEPTVGLDDWHRHLMLEVLDAIAAQNQTQLIYVSHTAGEHPRCITQHLQFIPRPLQSGAQDRGSIRSRSPYTLEIRPVPPFP